MQTIWAESTARHPRRILDIGLLKICSNSMCLILGTRIRNRSTKLMFRIGNVPTATRLRCSVRSMVLDTNDCDILHTIV